MAASVTGLHVFGPDTGPEPLSNLDNNYTALTAALNALSSFSNYYVDSSGAPNSITVTVPAPQTVAYTNGLFLQVKLANTNTATAVNINVNALGAKTVLLNDGIAPPIGSLTSASVLDLIYDGTNFRVMSLRASTTFTTGLFGDGSAASPAISFALDPDTGLYRVGANDLGFSTGGTLRLDLSTTALTSTLPWLGQDGTVGAPALSFSADPDTGIYRAAANNFAFTAGGTSYLDILGGSGVPVRILGGSIGIQDGTAGTPGLTFFNDPDSGLYRVGANDIALAAGGAQKLRIGTTFAYFNGAQIWADDGVVATPIYSFTNDVDTGIYRANNNAVAFSGAGAFMAEISATGITLSAGGSAATPAYSFNGDPNTGVYRSGADSISFAAGGVNAFQVLNAAGTLTTTINAAATDNLVLACVSSATANTGAAGAPPAQVVGYITLAFNGTTRKIPYYAN